MTLYLHIGYGKTATTSIQEFFQTHQHELAKKGVFWAQGLWQERDRQTGDPQPLTFGTAALPWFIANRLLDRLPRAEYPPVGQFYGSVLKSVYVDLDHFFRRLAAEKERYDKIIISSEDFSCFPYAIFFPFPLEPSTFRSMRALFIQECKDLLADFDDIKIIVNLRRQDTFIESGYNQVVSGPLCYEGTIDEFANFHACALDYLDNLDAWGAVFGRENVIVTPFEKFAMPRGPIQAFLDSINCDFGLGEGRGQAIHSNFSASPRLLNEKLYYNRRVRAKLSAQQHIKRQTYFDAAMRREKQSSFPILTKDEREIILRRFESSNKEVLRVFCSRKFPSLFSSNNVESAAAKIVGANDRSWPRRLWSTGAFSHKFRWTVRKRWAIQRALLHQKQAISGKYRFSWLSHSLL